VPRSRTRPCAAVASWNGGLYVNVAIAVDARVEILIQVTGAGPTTDVAPVKSGGARCPRLVCLVHGARVCVDDAEGVAERCGPLGGSVDGEDSAVYCLEGAVECWDRGFEESTEGVIHGGIGG